MSMQRRTVASTGLIAALASWAGLSGCTQPSGSGGFPGIGSWINGEGQLGGAVTLVNFWTYSCINSLRPMVYLRRWHAEYAAAGLRIIGVHTPEFGFESRRDNVEWAVSTLGIRYPVGQDNGYQTWRAWQNRAWPTFHVLNSAGRPIAALEGEGHAYALERQIRERLGLDPAATRRYPGDDPDLSRIGSPELYYGTIHPTPQEPAQTPKRGLARYRFTGTGPRLNRYELDGEWLREGEALVLRSGEGRLRLRYVAAKVHLVAGAAEGADLRARSAGGTWRALRVDRPALQTLVDDETYGERLLELEMRGPGLTLYSTTFG
jgi:thiol-disulfide isomerase/thioredoxin